MDDWAEEFFNSAIRAVMTAPRGQPSPMQAALLKAYHKHETAKFFSRDQEPRRSIERKVMKWKLINAQLTTKLSGQNGTPTGN